MTVFSKTWFRSAVAVAACVAHASTTRAVEPADTAPAEELRLAMPLSIDQPASLPVVDTFAQQLNDEPTPASDPATTTGRQLEVEYAGPKQSFDPFTTPGADGCDPFLEGGVYDEGPAFVQYPDNWLWGAGGSPYRTGPGNCDDWKVGPIWDVYVDGMTLFRDEADLDDLEDMARTDEEDLMLGDPRETQFGYGGGARIWAMGDLPGTEKYQIQFGYEGVDEWNAALLFPEEEVLIPIDPDPMMMGDEYNYETEVVRTLHYRSSMHSAEMNFFQRMDPTLRPFWGFRYIRFTDEIADTTNQQAAFPPPANVAMPVIPVTSAVTIEDSLEYIDIKNNLVGFQLGLREDLWHLNQRVTVQGFVNAGVYYNHVQFADGSIDTITTFIPDNATTELQDESQTLTSSTSEVSSSEPSDVAYLAEASITAICRLNKCVALRGGYQLFWVDGLALAEDAYLDRPLGRHNFLMQGWHAGIEYRR